MRLTVAFDVRKRCPYVDEQDVGRVEITHEVNGDGDGPELHALARELAEKFEAVADQPMSHEAFTRWVLRETKARDVVTRWRTSGMDVVIEAGPWDAQPGPGDHLPQPKRNLSDPGRWLDF